MLKNYLLTAIRHLQKNKVYSLINISGLAISIAVFILIFFFIDHELSYDRNFPQANRTFRIAYDMNLGGQTSHFALTPIRIGPMLREAYPEVETFTRMTIPGKQTVHRGNIIYREENVAYADSTFFQVFSFPFVAGDPAAALTRPNTSVISRTMAQRYFGRENPIGKTLKFQNGEYEVTGVVDTHAFPSHLQFSALISFATLSQNFLEEFQTDWFRLFFYTYLVFQQPEQAAHFQAKLDAFQKQHINPWIAQNDLTASVHYYLQPIRDIHLYSHLSYDAPTNSKADYVYIFGCVAFLILVIACINYINIVTAKSFERATEVGVRKAIGAKRRQLIFQFLGESFLITLFAIVAARVLVSLVNPVFEELTGIVFRPDFQDQVEMVSILVGVLIFVGSLGGIYPSLLISRFRPAAILSGNKNEMKAGGILWLRKGLLIVKFVISTVLIMVTIVVFQQMEFLRNQQLGFDDTQVMAIEIPPGDTTISHKLDAIRNELLLDTQVKEVSSANHLPGQQLGNLMMYVEHDSTTVQKAFSFLFVDYDFIDLMDMQLVAGRNFSRERPSDVKGGFIINETAARELGWTDPIGKKVMNGLGYDGEVIGVVKDFNFSSLHNAVTPIAIMLKPDISGYLVVKLDTKNVKATTGRILDTWKAVVTDQPAAYFFVDENFDQLYKAENNMLQLFSYFALLTIFIACLGLFGLSAFTVTQRTKEIGIRKVLGASIPDMVRLLSHEFALLVAVAFVLAVPIAYYAMHRWLQDFAYRIDINLLYFLLAGLLTFLLAMVTVGLQTVKAARANPVKSLRNE